MQVGYVSPDLCVHSVSYFAEAPLSHHRPKHVLHTIYSCTPTVALPLMHLSNLPLQPDEKTEHLRKRVGEAGGIWKDVAKLTERELADLIRENRIDILVELTGHTSDNRLGTMAMKPAPIQATADIHTLLI